MTLQIFRNNQDCAGFCGWDSVAEGRVKLRRRTWKFLWLSFVERNSLDLLIALLFLPIVSFNGPGDENHGGGRSFM